MKNSPSSLVNPTTGNTITLLLFRAPFREIKHLLRILSLLAATVGSRPLQLGWPLSADKRAREKTNCLQEAQRKKEEAKRGNKEGGGRKEASSTLVHLARFPSPVHRLQSSVEISSRPWSTKLLLLSKSLELAPFTSSGLLARSRDPVTERERGGSVHACERKEEGRRA